MIERQSDGELVNRIVNHPSIYPWICGPLEGQPLDLSPAIDSGSYIALFGEHGGFLFWNLGNGIYDAHSAILPEGRGSWAILAAQKSLKFMFEREGSQEIMMATPKGNVAVRALVRCLKAKYRGTIENGWFMNGQFVPSAIYSMTKTDWEECQ